MKREKLSDRQTERLTDRDRQRDRRKRAKLSDRQTKREIGADKGERERETESPCFHLLCRNIPAESDLPREPQPHQYEPITQY